MLRSLSPRMRRMTWMCLMVLGALVFAPVLSMADDEGQPVENGGAATVAADAGAGDGAAAGKNEQSLLEWTIEASGLWGLGLLLISFLMVALVVMNVLQVRRDNMMPPEFIEAFEQKLAAKDYQGAYETAKADDSFLARVLANGLGKLNRGYEEAIEGMQEVGEEENMTLEHRLSYLALIGAIAPDDRADGDGVGYDFLLPRDCHRRGNAGTGSVGKRCVDRLVHHARRALRGDSGHGLLRAAAKPCCPIRPRGRHGERRADEPILDAWQREDSGRSRACRSSREAG